MDAARIAAERDVAGQLVDLVAEGEYSAAPGFQRRAVCRSLNRMRKEVIHVEKGLEDRGASACIAGKGRGVGWVRGTSLWIGDGQQAGPIRGANPRDGLAPEDVRVDVVLPSSDRMGLDPAGEALRPEATVDLPFVEVGPLLAQKCCLRDQGQDVLVAEGDISKLRPRVPIYASELVK